MPKLLLEVGQYHNVLFGRVVAQCDSLRERGLLVGRIAMTVKSSARPQLYRDELHIRGANRYQDDLAFAHAYESETDASAALCSLRKCITEINADGAEPERPDTVVMEIMK